MCLSPCPLHGNPGVIVWLGCESGQREFYCYWADCSEYSEVMTCICEPDCRCLGGGGCFLQGTAIQMEDGTTKPIERVVVGDRVKAYESTSNSVRGADVIGVLSPREVEGYYEINGLLRVTGEHPVLIGSAWIKVRDLSVGDKLTAADGRPLAVTSIELIPKRVLVYNVDVEDVSTYIANDIVLHNKNLPYTAAPCLGCTGPPRVGASSHRDVRVEYLESAAVLRRDP